jgi:hypothetical protein
VASIARVRTVWSGAASAGSLSTHYFGATASVPTTADIQACVDRVRDFWIALNPGILAGVNWGVQGVVDFLTDTTGELEASMNVIARNGTGSLGADPLPYQTQGLVAWSTATVFSGHRLRGHTFVPAPGETENTGGAPISAYVTRLGTAAAALMAVGTWSPVIWHRPVYDAGGTLTRPGGQGLITGGTGRGYWSVLRSRR